MKYYAQCQCGKVYSGDSTDEAKFKRDDCRVRYPDLHKTWKTSEPGIQETARELSMLGNAALRLTMP